MSRAQEDNPFRQRSVKLDDDPKMQELKHFVEPHRHEARLRMVLGAEAALGGATTTGTLAELSEITARRAASPAGPADLHSSPNLLAELAMMVAGGPRIESPPLVPFSPTRMDGLKNVEDAVRRIACESPRRLPTAPGASAESSSGSGIASGSGNGSMSVRSANGNSMTARSTGGGKPLFFSQSQDTEQLGTRAATKDPSSPVHLPHLEGTMGQTAPAGATTAAVAVTSDAAALLSPRLCSAAELRLRGQLAWRGELNRTVRRLMLDVDMGRPMSLDDPGHRMVVDQFDRLYDWYRQNNHVQQKKSSDAPPYLRFDARQAPMPGSLRQPLNCGRTGTRPP